MSASLSRPLGADLNLWLARRRIARAAWLYLFLLVMTFVMMGPFVYSLLLSLSPNPTQYPPVLIPNTLDPRNLIAAYQLGREGSGNGLMGGWAPRHQISLEVWFHVQGQPTLPQVAVLPTFGGTGFANLASVTPPEVTRVEPVTPLGCQQNLCGYRFRFEQIGQSAVKSLPVEITVPTSMTYAGGTLAPTEIQNRFVNYALDYASLSPGLVPYLFGHYLDALFTFHLGDGSPAFPRWIFNSLLLAVIAVLTNVLFGSMAGFALARLRFPGKWWIFYFFVIFSQMLPAQVTLPSNYLVIKEGIFGLFPDLLNTYWAVILPSLVGGAAAFIMKQFLESIPSEIEEAARIDGANTWQVYRRIVLPMARPALIALTILNFQSSWNNFFWPFVVYTSERMYTLPIGLTFFKTFYVSGIPNWGLILAGAMISILPVILIFFFFQRYFVEGISFSGLKG
jgi:multiple sugar transport system permease protein